jgi:hypothetical protein
MKLSVCVSILAVFCSARGYCEEPATLEYRPAKGKTVRYKEVVTAPGRIDVWTLVSDYEIQKLTANGQFVVQQTVKTFRHSVQGQETELPATSKTTRTYDRIGKLVDSEFFTVQGGPSPRVGMLWDQMANPIFPSRPVGNGETWSVKVENPAVTENTYAVNGTFLGKVQLNGGTVWKVKQTAKANTDDNGHTMSFSAVFYISPVDGTIVQSESDVQDVLYPNGTTASYHSKRTLMEPE